ncbi:MAG: PorV/PorQ family protein [Calditrichaeota bacterium]|nr:PorV/PorQ family protein [Calditrichota bacterium]MCB9391802.1 PorV/PorQ family protein [Calditrichota bacterium]
MSSLLRWICAGAMAISLFVTTPVHAVSKVGTTAAPFLNISVGARALGMGGAFTAMADDATALYWNPAGLAGMDKFSASLVHTDWLTDLRFDVIGAVLPLENDDAIGAQITLLTMPEQEVTTTQQDEQDGAGYYYSAGSMALQLTYAKQFTDRFKLGLSGKYVREWIWHEAAATVAMDLGSVYRTDLNGMRIGIAITNFGGKMQMSGRDLVRYYDIDQTREGNNGSVLADLATDKWPLPLMMRFGLAMEAFENERHRLSVALDAMHPNDNDESLNFGAEYAFREQFFVRGGYKSMFMKDSEEGATVGFGVKLSTRGGPTFVLDAAYEDFGRFDAVYKYSLGIAY